MATKKTNAKVKDEVENAEVESNEVTDISENVEDITAVEATITKNTVYKVIRSFTTILGVNGTTGAEAGQKIKLSNLDEELIRALIKQGYIQIVK